MNPTKNDITQAMRRLEAAYITEFEVDKRYEEVSKEKRAAHHETLLARDEVFAIRFN